ncbi:MAG: hypothetical protein ABI879_04370 [Actinomycetota bacterium]
MITRRLALHIVSVSLLLAACSGGGGDDPSTSSPPTSPPPVSTVPPTPVTTTTPVAPPSPFASPPPTHGAIASDCVHGWVTPHEGTARFLEPLGIIRRTSGIEGPLVVMDMRYFEGPESPPSEQGYLLAVQRWYIRLYAKDDPSFQGRFLVEARRFGRGLSAVAAFDTGGWRSPDWTGFQFDSTDTTPKPVPGLPGAWEGVPYDFVTGGVGLQIPGLPAEVVGCLDGT